MSAIRGTTEAVPGTGTVVLWAWTYSSSVGTSECPILDIPQV